MNVWLRRKVRWLLDQFQSLQDQIDNIDIGEFREDFIIPGTTPTLLAEISAYVESSEIIVIEPFELFEYTSGQVVLVPGEWPRGGWPDVTHIYVESEDPENAGYFAIDTLTYEEPYLTIDCSTFPGNPGEIMVYLCYQNTIYKPKTNTDIGLSAGQRFSITGSGDPNNDGDYYITNVESIEGGEFIYSTSPAISTPSITLGEIYSLAITSDITFAHNFDSDFLDIEVYYASVKQDDDFKLVYIEQTDNNTVTLISSSFGTEQVGQPGKIFIKNLD